MCSSDLEVLIADTPEEFIKQIKRLLNDEVLYHLMIENARQFILKNYSWEENTNKINLLLSNQTGQ